MTAKSALAFTISREKLTEGLSAIAPALAGKTTLPILANIRVRSTANGVRLSGTDLDLAVETEVSADVQSEGSLTVPAKRMLAIAKELAPSPCHVSNGGSDVKLECGRSKYRLHSLPDDDFPAFPEVNFRGALRIAAGDLQVLAKLTAFAASRQETRPTLNGVLIQVDDEIMRFVATDGHRLALAERKISPNGAPFADAIVPTRALAQVMRLFEATDEVEIGQGNALGNHHLGFRSAETVIHTRLIEGPYPNYRQVIPKDHNREIIADRLALLAAARRLAPMATDSAHRIRLTLNRNSITLRATTPDVGEASDELPVRFDGETLETAVDAGYLIDILTAIDSDEIRMLCSSSVSAIVFKPVTRADRKGRFLYLLMPQRFAE